MKHTLLILTLSLLAISCGSGEDKRNEVSQSIIKNTTGLDIDKKNVDQIENNRVAFKLTTDEYGLNGKFNNAWSAITATKETIAITITSKDNESEHILMGFTSNDYTSMRPISGNMKDNTMTFTAMSFANNSMNGLLSTNATAEIVTWSDDKVVIKISGHLSTVEESANNQLGKPYGGTIILHHPLVSVMGSNIKDFQY